MPDAVSLLQSGGTFFQGIQANKAADKATKAQERAANAAIAEQRAGREDFNRRTQPFVDFSTAAFGPLAELLGLPVSTSAGTPVDTNRLNTRLAEIDELLAEPQQDFSDDIRRGQLESFVQFGAGAGSGLGGSVRAAAAERAQAEQLASRQALETERLDIANQLANIQTPQTSTGVPQTQLDQINPILSFLRDEGFEDIQESAAARGRLGSGGTLKDLTEFNTNLAATIVPQIQNQRFNQLFNVLGLGSNTATAQGTAGLNTATNIGSFLGNRGAAQAEGAVNKSNILGAGIDDLFGIAGNRGAFNFLNRPFNDFNQNRLNRNQTGGSIVNPNTTFGATA